MKVKKQRKGVLIITVGSTHVSALVSHATKNSILIENTHREVVGAGSEETRKDLEKQMLVALDLLLKNYAGDEFHDIRVIFSAPWHQAHIRTIHSKTEKMATISIGTIENIIEQYKNEAPPQSGNVDVEAVAVQVRVNNYTTSLKDSVHGTQTTINLYESEMSQSLQRSVHDVIEKHTPNMPISFYTFPLVAGVSLRDMMLETSFVYADIGGEVTEIGVMHGDGIHFLGSIPVGYWTIIRKMGGEKIGDTYSRMALWLKGELTEEEAENISNTFTEAFKPWLAEFEDMLKDASTLVPVPRSVFLVSDSEPARWLSKGVEDLGSMNLTPTIITPVIAQKFIEVGEGGSFDIPLSLAAIFFHIGELGVVGEPEPRKMVYSK